MKNNKSEDFSKFIEADEKSRKEKLIENCQKLGISVYIDDNTETSLGAYSALRGVASEAELERRIDAKITVKTAQRSNIISIIAIIIAAVSLIVSLLD